jgi:hypothetical protein
MRVENIEQMYGIALILVKRELRDWAKYLEIDADQL